MNGNFEIDKGSYPYTATRIGDSTFVLHTPSQQKVLEVALPHSVAANVALRINTNYHAAMAGGVPVIEDNPYGDRWFDGSAGAMYYIACQEARAAHFRGDLDGAAAQQLNDLLLDQAKGV